MQATNANGTGTATSAAVTPTAAPGGGDAGVTINSAAIATNSPGVTLTIHEPSGATAVKISNDGGFASATPQPIRGDDTYTWTLQSPGAERLPKTVYVRFTGAGNDGPDLHRRHHPRPAPAAGPGRRALGQDAEGQGAGTRAPASPAVQYTKARDSRQIVTRDYQRKLRVNSKRQVRFVRFVDGAGNYSPGRRSSASAERLRLTQRGRLLGLRSSASGLPSCWRDLRAARCRTSCRGRRRRVIVEPLKKSPAGEAR